MSAPTENNQAQEQSQPAQTAPPAQVQEKSHAAPAAQTANNGPVNDEDVNVWKGRFNDILARPSDHLNSSSPGDSQPWHTGFFDCFNPIESCLVTYFLPCVTFGKTYHRMHKDPELKGYEPVNTTCLLALGSACVGCFCVPVAMQHQEMRHKYKLEGSCISDILRSCCCGCCTLIQQEKEAEYREGLLRQVVQEQYQPNNNNMAYPA